MLYRYAFLDGGLFAALMCALRLLLMILRPEFITLQYPPAMRRQLSVDKSSLVGLIRLMLSILAGVIAFTVALIILQYCHQPADFYVLFGHCFIMVMTWQIVDLIIFDLLLVCTFMPKYLMVSTSGKNPSIRNYGYYANLFLKGFVPYCMGAAVIAGIAYILLKGIK